MYYIITKNNQVLLGPLEWRPGYFSAVLENRGIEVSFPVTPPSTYLDLVDVEVYPVDNIEQPVYNATYQEYSGPYWGFTGGKAFGYYTVIDRDLQAVKQSLKQQATSSRYDKEIKGIQVQLGTVTVTCDTSRSGRLAFVEKLLTMADQDTINWKFPEGWLLLDKTAISYLISSINKYIQDCFDEEIALITAVDAATSISELKALVE